MTQQSHLESQSVEPVGDRRLEEAVTSLLEQESRIIIGPWLGEVGWEVLYWIPLLRWCVARWPELKDRVVVVSRGGVADWYEGVSDTYVDVFEAYDETMFSRRLRGERAARRARGESSVKQREVSEWELEIAGWVSEKVGESLLPILHPSVLFRSMKFVLKLPKTERASFVPWRPPDRGVLDSVLPERYVAVRFSESGLFQDPGFAEAVTCALADQLPVVMLYPGMETDYQHPDFDTNADVIRLAPHVSFRDNLATQSIAIANASAYVGNFGGLAFIGPHYGVDSVCFWSRFKTAIPRELEYTERVFSRPGWGSLTAQPCDAAPIEDLLAPVLGEPSR